VGTVLIVDDEPEVRRAFRRGFMALGWEADAVPGFEDALKCLKDVPPDLALVDLFLQQGPDGLSLVRAGREVSPNTTFVVMTGRAKTELTVEAIRLGALDVVDKSIPAAEIVRRCEARRSVAAERPLSLHAVTSAHIQNVLTLCHGSRTDAARTLGISRRGLQLMLHKMAPSPTGRR
jgi:ActR/RegA family two-component response regulator